MLLVAAQARRLLRSAQHLSSRRPILMVYALLRVAVNSLELLLLVLQQQIPYAPACIERLLQLWIPLDPLVRVRRLILDDGLWPVERDGGSGSYCRACHREVWWQSCMWHELAGGPGMIRELRSSWIVSPSMRPRFSP